MTENTSTNETKIYFVSSRVHFVRLFQLIVVFSQHRFRPRLRFVRSIQFFRNNPLRWLLSKTENTTIRTHRSAPRRSLLCSTGRPAPRRSLLYFTGRHAARRSTPLATPRRVARRSTPLAAAHRAAPLVALFHWPPRAVPLVALLHWPSCVGAPLSISTNHPAPRRSSSTSPVTPRRTAPLHH